MVARQDFSSLYDRLLRTEAFFSPFNLFDKLNLILTSTSPLKSAHQGDQIYSFKNRISIGHFFNVPGGEGATTPTHESGIRGQKKKYTIVQIDWG